MKEETITKQTYIYNPNHFKYGCLEPKAKVEKPTQCDGYKESFVEPCIKESNCECGHYLKDQMRIEQGRIAVSRELFLKEFNDLGIIPGIEFIKDTDFTVRDGKAYPVEVIDIDLIGIGKSEQETIKSLNKIEGQIYKKLRSNYYIKRNLLTTETREIAKDIALYFKSLQSENERLKEELDKAIDTSNHNCKMALKYQNEKDIISKLQSEIQSLQAKLDIAIGKLKEIAQLRSGKVSFDADETLKEIE